MIAALGWLMLWAGVLGAAGSGLLVVAGGGSGPALCLIGSLVLTVLGWLVVGAGNREACPSCSEAIKPTAKLCPYCRTATGF